MAGAWSPRVHVFASDRAVARALARRIAEELSANPRLVLGLPTGRTPIGLYQELVSLHAHGRADFSAARTFNLDEFFGIPNSSPHSYRHFMERHLFSRINLPASHVHFLNGVADNAEAECARYEAAIAAEGGIDLQVLGIGTNGHIGFNEPARELQSRTHHARLRPETRRSNAALFGGDAARVPDAALSMGMATILQARAIVLVATGRSKAQCVQQMLEGPVTTELPASFLQLHRSVDVMLDEPAAARLRSR